MKKFFIYDIEYSQTDKETVIIQETCKTTAEVRLKSWYPNARYISYRGVSTHLIE
jgi:hypothetical protein